MCYGCFEEIRRSQGALLRAETENASQWHLGDNCYDDWACPCQVLLDLEGGLVTLMAKSNKVILEHPWGTQDRKWRGGHALLQPFYVCLPKEASCHESMASAKASPGHCYQAGDYTMVAPYGPRICLVFTFFILGVWGLENSVYPPNLPVRRG